MAGKLPIIKIPFKLPSQFQVTLPSDSIRKTTLPPVSVPTNIKPFPIVDINKTNTSSIFQNNQSDSDELLKTLDFINKSEGIIDEKIEDINTWISSLLFEGDKNRIKAIILKKTSYAQQYVNDSMDWLNEDNIKIAETMLKNENFSRPENIPNIILILKTINMINNSDKTNQAFRLSLIPKLIEKYGQTKDIDALLFIETYENITPETVELYFPDSAKKNIEFEKSKEKIKETLLNRITNEKDILEVNEIIYSLLNETNFEIAEIISKNKDFGFKEIKHILPVINEINKDIIKAMCTRDKCKIFRTLETINFYIEHIGHLINPKNIKFGNWILFDDEAEPFRTGDSKKCCDNISTLIEQYQYCPEFTDWICKNKESQCFRVTGAIEHIPNIVRAYSHSKNGFGDWICKSEETEYLRTSDNIKYIPRIIWQTKEEIIPFVKIFLTDKEYEEFRTPDNIKYIGDILAVITKAKLDMAKEFLNNKNIPKKLIRQFIGYNLDYNDYEKIIQKMGKEKVLSMDKWNFPLAVELQEIYQSQNINELSGSAKKKFLNKLIEYNTRMIFINDELQKDFPLVPVNAEEYCELLPQLVSSLGIEIKKLNENEISSFNHTMNALSNDLAKLSDKEFADLEISQEFSRNDFILTVLEKIKVLQQSEKKKVFDYFGFELKENDGTESGYTITGYPINSNNSKKYSQIENAETKEVIENLRNDIIRFSENNRIKSNNPAIESLLNDMAKALPELHTLIGNKQHGIHNFDVMKHSLKVMQKIVQSEEYQKLSESDKKVILLASLLHDITKFEAHSDKTHSVKSSFDAYFITKKFNLTSEEEIKLYTLINNHEWLEYVNTAENKDNQIQRMKSVAFDLRQDNLFDMALMFTHADLRAVKNDDSFHDKTEGAIGCTIKGIQRSLGESTDIFGKKIKEYIHELKKSQPLLPVTKIPSADIVKTKVTKVNPDGSTNIKGLYLDKEGLPIIKFNEVENWEELGFPEGTVARGIKTQIKSGEADTGNIKFFVHGLDEEYQLINFDAFSFLNSNALLSVIYAERPESKFKFYRSQGIILDVDANYVYGGGESEGGSGWKKTINEFKQNYILGGRNESERLFISNLIKEATGMNDEQYIISFEENKNKSMLEIKPVEFREKLIRAFAIGTGEKEYTEYYVSNPKPMATFAYSSEGKIGNPVEYFEKHENLAFLTRFSKKRNLPRIVFGD